MNEDFRNRVESLHAFKLRQCNENVMIAKKLEELEQDLINITNPLIIRIEKLEDSRLFNRDNRECLNEALHVMQDEYKQMIKDLQIQIDQLKAIRFPNLCPNCKGKGVLA